MLCQQLFEGPEQDLNTVRYTQRMLTKIMQFLTQKTEHTPLQDCGFTHAQAKRDEIWMFPVTEAGLPHRNVRFAIGWRPAPASKETVPRAYVTSGREAGETFILLVVLLQHNPAMDTDLGYKLNWSDLVHEFIHVLDARRGYQTHRDKLDRQRSAPYNKTPHRYFNSPIEFNAYYQQGVEKILRALATAALKAKDVPSYQHAYRASVLSQFAAFRREFRPDFDASWLPRLKPTMQRRFLKRFYQLYHYARTHWPDIDAIRSIADEQAEIDARFAAEQAAGDS